MAQRTGALVFDERTDRYDIRFDLNTYYGGLHCGECFDVFVRGKWKPIAALEGITPSQAGKSIHAALRRLRRYFARQKWMVNL